MIKVITGTILVLAAASSANAQSTKFNLECSGTLSVTALGLDQEEPYSATYRIDLEANRWCESECKALHTIEAVQPTQITLQDKKTDGPLEQGQVTNFINRETGAHFILSSSRNPRQRGSALIMEYKGNCEPAAFTGFPEFQTRF